MTSATPAFPAHWRLSDPVEIADTFSSRVHKVVRKDGSPAVVQALKPFDDVADELRGAHYLKWRQGEGAVRLLGMEAQMMLLEYAGDRLLTAHLDEFGDRSAIEIAADVTARLFAPSQSAPPPELQPLRQRFVSLFRKAAADRKAGAHSLYGEAAELAARLLDHPRDVKPLHGDLHHDNVISGPRGWLAIDPKGVLGDPGFDAANWFYNPLDRDALCLDEERIAAMADAFATALRQDSATILDHAIAYGCLSASWHAEDGNRADEDRELAIAAAIRAVRRRI